MGFPVGYTELLLPTLLIHTLTFLTILKKLLFTLFNFIGLPPDFLEPGPTPLLDPDPPTTTTSHHHRQPPLSAILLRELLPLVRVPSQEKEDQTRSCAVCLYDLCKGDEIRWLSNCKHIFHRDCLDRWMDLDHRTCPLCRSPFLPDHLLHEFNQRLLAADGGGNHSQPLDDHFMYVDHDSNHTTTVLSPL